jgi:hypothetical protein
MLQWERNTAQFANGEKGMLGKVRAFYVFYNSSRPKGSDETYTLNCMLPGIKDTIGNFEDSETAKERADRVLIKWLELAGLKGQ